MRLDENLTQKCLMNCYIVEEVKMTLSIDEVFQEIGEFHKFQWLMLTIIGYTVFATGTFPVMIVTFITAEPNWQCVKGYNSSICNFNESIGLTSKHYKDRCDMPREAWTYVEGFTSTVTEVIKAKFFILFVVSVMLLFARRVSCEIKICCFL